VISAKVLSAILSVAVNNIGAFNLIPKAVPESASGKSAELAKITLSEVVQPV
jgi:hypothetical protein